MEKVRVGIIGMGNMGAYHADYLLKGKVNRCELTAVCSTSPQKLEKYKPVAIFGDGIELINSGLCDAIMIATPHYQHASLGVAALEKGLHIMVEKPIAAHKADAEKLIEASKKNSSLVFGAMFQLRTEPRYQKIKSILEKGELGDIVRMNWIITDWYRTEAYYQSGGWRATWKGEGGGVLINQCLHNLDSLQWLLGMPSKVRSFCQLGRFHDIEVEDNVTAYLEFPGGATGIFVTSSGEAPGTNRLEIAGTLGKLVLEKDKITVVKNEESMITHCKTSKIGFLKPDIWNCEVPFSDSPAQHATLMQNFVNAILDGEKLICRGEDGLHSIELANSILYSSLVDSTVDLPLDSSAYGAKLNELIENSTHVKKVAEVSNEDFAKSFNK